MSRFALALISIAALTFSGAALAADDLDAAPQTAVVQAAEDALALPVTRPQPRQVEEPVRTEQRLVPHGSNQSAAGFRFQSPYAYPIQTLPLAFPALGNLGF